MKDNKSKVRPNKKDYREFEKNYKGTLDVDRAYLFWATGNHNYRLRRDIYPGSINDLPEEP